MIETLKGFSYLTNSSIFTICSFAGIARGDPVRRLSCVIWRNLKSFSIDNQIGHAANKALWIARIFLRKSSEKEFRRYLIDPLIFGESVLKDN